MTNTWFITGTSSGFGRLLTERLLARGDRVAATLRRMDALDDLRGRYGDRLWISSLDLTDGNGIRETVNRAFEELGRINVVVNNAGYGLFGAAEEVTDEQIHHQINTNLVGSIQVIRAALPHLREQGGGRVLQISSEGGQVTYPSFSLYHATKWGIEGFVETVAKEVANFGITFTIFEPGPTGTNFGTGLIHAPRLEVYQETAAGEVRRALASGKFAITGDPAKMTDAILACAAQERPPLRLALGSAAYIGIRSALEKRLAELEAQVAVTASLDLEV